MILNALENDFFILNFFEAIIYPVCNNCVLMSSFFVSQTEFGGCAQQISEGLSVPVDPTPSVSFFALF